MKSRKERYQIKCLNRSFIDRGLIFLRITYWGWWGSQWVKDRLRKLLKYAREKTRVSRLRVSRYSCYKSLSKYLWLEKFRILCLKILSKSCRLRKYRNFFKLTFSKKKRLFKIFRRKLKTSKLKNFKPKLFHQINQSQYLCGVLRKKRKLLFNHETSLI